MPETVAAPVEENAAESEIVEQPPVKAENGIVLSPEKLEDYKRKLSGSKDEALRFRAENERLSAEKARLEAEINAFKTGQGQTFGHTYQPTPDELQIFKTIAKQAGVPLREELDQIKSGEEERQKNEVVNAFISKFPEYGKIGDPQSDALWEELTEELGNYVPPKDVKQWGKLLEKAHKVLRYDPSTALERGKALGMAQATLKGQATVGGSGGGGSAPAPKSKAKTAIEQGFAQIRPEIFT